MINGDFHTNGGRVLNVIGQDLSLNNAIKNAYGNVKKIHFQDMYFRTDIGQKGLKYLRGISDE